MRDDGSPRFSPAARPPSPVLKHDTLHITPSALNNNNANDAGLPLRLTERKSAKYNETIRKIQQEQQQKLEAAYTFKPALDKRSLLLANKAKKKKEKSEDGQKSTSPVKKEYIVDTEDVTNANLVVIVKRAHQQHPPPQTPIGFQCRR